MSNSFFRFKKFTIHQDRTAMKVTTDACLFGAWIGSRQAIHKVLGTVDNPGIILDVGTGTGLLALMLAQKMPYTILDAVELDDESFEQAKENIAASPWPDRVNIIQDNARTFIHLEKYDIVISNPPFYVNDLKGTNTKKNIAHHDDGLLLPELLTVIKNNLSRNGRFYLLLPYKRNDEIRKLLLEHDLNITELVLVRQSVKHDYFRIMLEGSFDPGQLSETNFNEMAIKYENENYTEEFIELLKDYYLKL